MTDAEALEKFGIDVEKLKKEMQERINNESGFKVETGFLNVIKKNKNEPLKNKRFCESKFCDQFTSKKRRRK